jgi:hypothetical protein
MALCPTECLDEELIANVATCKNEPRERALDRIGFMRCDTDLPQPFTCDAIETLVENGDLVFSSPLSNVEVQDPEFEELTMADCQAPIKVVTQRIVNFNDRLPIDIEGGTGSPASSPNPFFNYEFWDNKLNQQKALRTILTYCDGSVTVPKDKKGNFMSVNLDAFTSYERTTGNNATTYEFIKATLTYKGDPMALYNKPQLDADGNVFDISQCNIGI